VRSHRALAVADGRVDLRLTLARHEVTLVELDAVQDETPAWVDDSRILGRG
jgi:xylan 1,4-beta-xylosidase